MRNAAKKAGVTPPSSRALSDYRLYYAHLANLTSKRSKPGEFATIPIPTLGVVFIDLAFIYPQWKAYNGGYAAFLVAVEASTQQLAAFAMKGKTTDDWRKAVLQVLDESVIPSVKTFVCDREPAVFSKHFRTRLRNERGGDITFLTRRHKSYRAESMIRWVKVALARTVAQRKAAGDPDYRVWVDALPTVVKSFNRRKAHDTSFRRADIHVSNYKDYINELFQTSDASLLFNSGSLNADRLFSAKWLQRLFKFDVGDEVLVHRNATRQHGEAFAKPSVRGSFLPDPAKVAARWLKRTLKQFLVPGEFQICQGTTPGCPSPLSNLVSLSLQCTSSRTKPREKDWTDSTTVKSLWVCAGKTAVRAPRAGKSGQETTATPTLRDAVGTPRRHGGGRLCAPVQGTPWPQ